MVLISRLYLHAEILEIVIVGIKCSFKLLVVLEMQVELSFCPVQESVASLCKAWKEMVKSAHTTMMFFLIVLTII